MLISIALCTYNGARYLEEQLESIANQTRLPDELVICDDQSQDNTLEIVKKFSSKVSFPVRIVLNEKNIGSSKNFEKAIGLCTGDIIFLSDQDDVWVSAKLEQMEKVFSTSPNVGAVFTDAEAVDEKLQPLGYGLWQSVGFTENYQKNFTEGKSLEVLLKHNVVTGATMAFRSEFKDLFFPISGIWVHDGWIALSIAFASNLVIIPEPLIKYRQHSMQQLGSSQPLNAYEKVNEKIRQLWDVKNSSYDFQPECDRYTVFYNHLVNSQFPSIKRDKIPLLKARIEHFCVRANLPLSRSKRIPIAVKELFKLSYHRYSYGIGSFCGDIFRDNPKFIKSKKN
ncbi:glycosyltransferase family 2 protein [Methanosarcina sp.]|uniref:glycosyltransferase family 2 protein n=1 Tax=Methanosarcina sp. TaxID=2213 RepID=UPI002ABB7C89|nr:glycosyltransferase family 2 protein [Methanosarcina sp.]MDY9927603.1 glycosyltransferase family 2 protein [Methanosarcina sp.]